MFSVRCWMLNVALALCLFSCARNALAALCYVDVNSTNSHPPYTSWATAATNIQDAVDAAVTGDEIVVTNGTYRDVALDKPLSLRSVNGPQFTTIDGGQQQRCVTLPNGADLSGFNSDQRACQCRRWRSGSIGERSCFQLRVERQHGG